MKREQVWRWVLAAMLLAMGGTTGWAREVAIPSSGEMGRLSYGTLNNGINQNYRTMVHEVQVVREFSR